MAHHAGGGFRGRNRPGPYRKDRPKVWRQNQPGAFGEGSEQQTHADDGLLGEHVSPFKPVGGGSQDTVPEGEAGNGPGAEGGPTPKKEKKFTNRSRLFVGNLPRDMSETELKKLFEPYGEVQEVFHQKEKNFGFVRMVWWALFRILTHTLILLLSCILTLHSTGVQG